MANPLLAKMEKIKLSTNSRTKASSSPRPTAFYVMDHIRQEIVLEDKPLMP